MKKALSFLLTVVLAFSLLSFPVSAAAVEDEAIEPQNILCNVLGHKFTASTAYIIDHLAYSTGAERCLKKTYKKETCSRCGYSTKTLLRTERIECC